jgi:hypothetical protein
MNETDIAATMPTSKKNKVIYNQLVIDNYKNIVGLFA